MSEPDEGSPLRVLHLEDSPNDAELIRAELEMGSQSVTIERVDSRESFIDALAQGEFDLILSDFSLPGFDGLSALRIAKEMTPDVPFISVSGQLGEESAVETVRSGATDYVLKQRLARLNPSVQRALLEARERRQRLEAEEALRRSEAQLRQAQKMEPLGRLAGGVAHDFNNLLTIILGYSGMVEVRLKNDPEGRSEAQQITRAGERAAALTRRLLAFSRQQVLETVVLDVNRLVTDMGQMLRRLIGADVELLTVPSPGLGKVRADGGQLEQVIMNLAVNARDAMPKGGKLTIETANVEFEEHYQGAHGLLEPGRYVLLAMTDTGCGMSEEIKSRMFEPFFTSKEVGKGTGLGLAMVHGIVKQSGGHIEVYSELGQGTTFKIYLPLVEESGEGVASAPEAIVDGRGTETVLLVEDDEGVRTLLGESLRRNGYTVLLATDGSEAMSLVRQMDRSIDILVTDVVMPLMSGPELVQLVGRVRPYLPVLFISGYTSQALIHQGLRHSDSFFLQKPFQPEALARKIRVVLDASGPRHAAA